MFRYVIILVLLVLGSVAPAMAVDTLQVTLPDPVLEQWRWRTFDGSSGLAGRLRDIFEDRDGNIWFATDQGAQRYDGLHWTTYTTEDGLAHNIVRSVMQDRDGVMWFGTYGGGISRFDGKTWTTYTTDDGLATNSLLWRGLLQDRDGAIWAGCWSAGDSTGAQAGISRFDGQSWTVVEVPVGPPRPSIRYIYQAADGALWFTTRNQGVLRLDGTRWTRYTSEEGLAGNSVTQMIESQDGAFWFACWQDGISRYDGRQWQTYTAGDGLPENVSIFSLWEAEDGTVWAGSNNRLYRFDGNRWKAYTSEALPEVIGNFVFGLQTREGATWIWGWFQNKAFRFDPV